MKKVKSSLYSLASVLVFTLMSNRRLGVWRGKIILDAFISLSYLKTSCFSFFDYCIFTNLVKATAFYSVVCKQGTCIVFVFWHICALNCLRVLKHIKYAGNFSHLRWLQGYEATTFQDDKTKLKKSTVDAPLTDHIWQFCWYFSYLFELNIWHFIFQKYCFFAI